MLRNDGLPEEVDPPRLGGPEPEWAIVHDQTYYPWVDYYETEQDARAVFDTLEARDGLDVLLVQVVAVKTEDPSRD